MSLLGIKMKSLLFTPLIFLTACGTLSTNIASSPSDGASPNASESEVSNEEIGWEDLRIQKLMPDFLAIPAIEPFLPDNFIALPHPKKHGVFWGPKETLEEYFLSGNANLCKSPMLCVQISTNVGQKQDGSFTCEDTMYDEYIAAGVSDVKIEKFKWGDHPVLSATCAMDGKKVYLAYVGLNYEGCALVIGFIDVSKSDERFQVWTDFLTKSRPLEEHDFFKVHGQDLREGFTLVNVYGSLLKVSAEKRTRDGKIQVSIQPADHTISCKCLRIAEKTMGAKWHFMEPIVKIQAEVQVNSTANIVSNQTITVLLKEVLEFSHKEMNASDITVKECNNISILNFCAQSQK